MLEIAHGIWADEKAGVQRDFKETASQGLAAFGSFGKESPRDVNR